MLCILETKEMLVRLKSIIFSHSCERVTGLLMFDRLFLLPMVGER